MQIKISINEGLFFIASAFAVIAQIIGYSLIVDTFDGMNFLIRVLKLSIFMCFLGSYIITQKTTIKKCLFLLCICLAYVASIVAGREDIVLIFVLAILAVDIKPRKVVMATLYPLLFMVVAVILLSLVGVLPDHIYNHRLIDGSVVRGHCLGFSYYSYVPMYVLSMTCMVLWIKKEKIRYSELVLLAVVVWITNEIFQKQLTFYLNMLMIVAFLIVVKWDLIKFSSRVWNFLSPLIVIIPCVLIGYCSYNFNRLELAWLDTVLSGRIKYGYQAFQRYGLHLLGSRIELNGSSTYVAGSMKEYFYLDSGYMQLMFFYGIVITIIVLGIYAYLLYKAFSAGDKTLVLWITISLMYNVLGSTIIDYWHNPLFVLAVSIMLTRKNINPLVEKNNDSSDKIKRIMVRRKDR